MPELDPVAITREMPAGSLPERCDVIVAGGGPAGSTATTLLARLGWSVALLEKDLHPRFHIGESLLPMILPILQHLGVLETVAGIGVLKEGADFPAPTPEGYNVFRFERALDTTWSHAHQVRRDQVDKLLYDNAAASRAAAFAGHRVTAVQLDRDSVVADVRTDDRRTMQCRARYLVDAAGCDTLLGSQLRMMRRSRRHQSATLFAHFRGVRRQAGADAGNLSIYRFDQGWIWLIPLPDDVMSIGAVCWPDYLKQRRTGNREFLLQTLQSVPALRHRIESAEIVSHLQATGNYSYSCNRIAGRRWIMAGDAYAFVDPVFSSGVYLAMHAAERATEVVDGAMRKLFAGPRNILKVEQAMISMLAGDFYRDNGVLWRLRLFKLLYWIAAFGELRGQVDSYLFRRRQAGAVLSGGANAQDAA
jgi:flavin-dependent dehydrogenase